MSAQGLPPNILPLFGPRPPPNPLPTAVEAHRRNRGIDGVADFIDQFEDEEPPKKSAYVPPLKRKIQLLKEKFAKHAADLEARKGAYDPKADSNAGESSALATLFVFRISFDTSEKKLRRESSKKPTE